MRKTRGKRRTFRKMFGGVHGNTPETSTAIKSRATLKSRASAFFKPLLPSVFKPRATGENFKNNNDIYKGKLNYKGQRHGKVIMMYENGDVYEGYWKDGKMHGKGTMRYENGDVYVGDWKDGKMDGEGTMRYENGDVYEGDWKDGKMDGEGTMTNKKGAKYSAKWKDGKKTTTPRYEMYRVTDANNVTIGWTTIKPKTIDPII